MRTLNLCVLLLLTYLSGCTSNPNQVEISGEAETIIYYGGDILTMVSDEPLYAEALVTDARGNITFTGSLDEASNKFSGSKRINLNGKTLLPGFVDGHAHFAGFPAQAIGAKILPPPDAGVSNIPDLINVLKAWATPENIALTGWIFGMGFDDSVIEEKRFPTKKDLDKVSTKHPIMIIHISGHFAVVNSKGLEMMNITTETPDPAGGIIRRVAGTMEPNGVLEELAAIPYMPQVLNPKSAEAGMQFLKSGQDMALSYGYTTVQEGRAMQNSHSFLVRAASAEKLKLDVVSYIDYSIAELLDTSMWYSPSYRNHYRIAGIKLTLDGSPQGRTAWRTLPYLIPPEGAGKDYHGYPAIPNDQDVIDIYEMAFNNNWQILTHANGDAAMDQMIRTMGAVWREKKQVDRRNVLIHGQYVREDQLDEFLKMDVIASLFPLHTYYWGDWHKQLTGPELGNKISPTRTALNKGMKLTIHTDAPVALPNLMRVVWTAVNRTSRSGEVIGESERLTPYEALKCITDWSAYQHFEEATKGTLEVGKLADLVILDQNPLKVEIDAIKDIEVYSTIKAGRIVYAKSETKLSNSP